MITPTPAQLDDIACLLAGCQPADLIKVRLEPDGSLIVIVHPGPKFHYPPDLVILARARLARPNDYATDPHGNVTVHRDTPQSPRPAAARGKRTARRRHPPPSSRKGAGG